MTTTGDELAGVVDLFGALTREELVDALTELAFKQGETVDRDAISAAIGTALADYVLVEYEPAKGGESVNDGRNGSESGDSSGNGDSGSIDSGGNSDGDDTSGSSNASDSPEDAMLAVGPAAFPTLPPNAEDLPHILDIESRRVDRDRLVEQVRRRLEADAEAAVENNASERAAELHDISYDVEAWAGVAVDEVRASLSALLPQD
jgi:hypothetical protein